MRAIARNHQGRARADDSGPSAQGLLRLRVPAADAMVLTAAGVHKAAFNPLLQMV